MGEQQVAQIIVESIYNAGVKTVFGIPGMARSSQDTNKILTLA